MSSNDLYSEHADTIESVFAYTRRAKRLSTDAGEEFASWARVKLLENDRRILREFKGQSTVKTFLISVILHLYHDWRNHEWGRWRPSLLARRHGPVAIELEREILRDGTEFEQACEVLVSKGVAESRAQCSEVWALLRHRPFKRHTGVSELENQPAAAQADPVLLAEQTDRAAIIGNELARSFARLEPQDRLVIQLHFLDGFTVARIAKLLDVEQKPLYRRIDQIKAQLRA